MDTLITLLVGIALGAAFSPFWISLWNKAKVWISTFNQPKQ